MNTWQTLAACIPLGGAAGYLVSALRPTGRRRGPRHRRLWQPAPAKKPDPSNAPTVTIPMPGGGAHVPEEETC